MSRRQFGAAYEAEAIRYLETQGLTLVERNFNTGSGEIDVIMRHAEYWVFVEVKYRRDETFAAVFEQIEMAQRLRIRRAAQVYLVRHSLPEHHTAVRFDVVAIVGEPYLLEWLPDAF